MRFKADRKDTHAETEIHILSLHKFGGTFGDGIFLSSLLNLGLQRAMVSNLEGMVRGMKTIVGLVLIFWLLWFSRDAACFLCLRFLWGYYFCYSKARAARQS